MEVAKAPLLTAHGRYLQVYQLIQQRDRAMANAFNDYRRSTAIEQLILIRAQGLLTTAEVAQFSPAIQAITQVG